MLTPDNNINDGTTFKKKRICPKCKQELDTRVPRGTIFKTFLFWLPVKRYICYNCQRKRYIWS
jgi:hypothetical protein